jgi:Domain of unknown function (DUF4419)
MNRFLTMKTTYLLLATLFSSHFMGCHAQTPAFSKKTVIPVCEVSPAKKSLREENYKDFLSSLLLQSDNPRSFLDTAQSSKKKLEMVSSHAPKTIIPIAHNGFFDAVQLAYAQHHPLILSPDIIWLLISQGFAVHLNENAEKLRPHFVTFEGKKELNIQLDHYPLSETQWEGVFDTFKQQIAGYTGKKLTDLVAARFSGTSTDAQVAFDITLMDAMKNYFDYSITVLCGIPQITLEGTVEDWQQLEDRTAQLAQYDLEWWVEDLKPILKSFTNAVKGQKDVSFWQKIMKIHYESKGCTSDSYITGWIGKFYPYINQDGKFIRNPLLGIQDFEPYFAMKDIKNTGSQSKHETYSGPKVEPKDLPNGISSAELFLDNNGVHYALEVKAGFFGIQQENVALRPVMSWAVVNTGKKPDAERLKRYQDFLKNRAAQKPLTIEPAAQQKH